MPKISGYHPICHLCDEDNPTPKRKWCPSCREKERRRERNRKPFLKNPCGMGYVETVRADGPEDNLLDGLQCRPGHAPGWYELV